MEMGQSPDITTERRGMKFPPSGTKPIIRSERGSIMLDGERYRYAKVGEKSYLHKVIEQPKEKTDEQGDIGSTESAV